MLLSGLPVQCPPLDLLQVEMEKFYILRPTAPAPPTTPPPAPQSSPPPSPPPVPLPAPSTSSPAPPLEATSSASLQSSPSAPSRSDWARLETARKEALEAAIESKSLFRLFFDRMSVNEGGQRLDSLASKLRELEAPLRAQDVAAVLTVHQQIMRLIVAIGDLTVASFPYTVSKAVYCEGLPRLLGRACIECIIDRPPTSAEFMPNDPKFPIRLTIVADGFAAPITAGNFVDLVQRGFYNGLPIGRKGSRLPRKFEASGKVLTSGQPADLGGNVTGFVDPRTGSYRTLPVEILPLGASEPTYPLSAENSGRSMSQPPALPFRAAGSIGMVHSLGNPDDASSEFFMTTAPLSPSVDNELTSQLDGVYTLFGFVLDGCDELPKICTGDVITSMRCFDGKEKLQRPNFNPSYVRRRREASRDYQMLGEQNEGLGEYDGGAIPASVPLIEDAESQEQGLRYVGPAKGGGKSRKRF